MTVLNVGIDYSLNSPGIAVRTSKDNIFFFTVQKKDNKTNRKLNMLNDVNIITVEPEDTYSKWDFIDAQTNAIINTLEELMRLHKADQIIISLEDYIYYSQQNSLIDIVEATTILKWKIIKKWGTGVLNLYSPTAVKKSFSGTGRAKKEDMLKTFNDLNLKTPFAEWCRKLEKTHKPEEDLIDAYAILTTMEKEMKQL